MRETKFAHISIPYATPLELAGGGVHLFALPRRVLLTSELRPWLYSESLHPPHGPIQLALGVRLASHYPIQVDKLEGG